jgi:hypothetical protein
VAVAVVAEVVVVAEVCPVVDTISSSRVVLWDVLFRLRWTMGFGEMKRLKSMKKLLCISGGGWNGVDLIGLDPKCKWFELLS